MAHKVIFTPSGIRATAEAGQSVYDVALASGVDILSICGGKGLCRRCQIEFEPGDYPKFGVKVEADNLSGWTDSEEKALKRGDLIGPGVDNRDLRVGSEQSAIEQPHGSRSDDHREAGDDQGGDEDRHHEREGVVAEVDELARAERPVEFESSDERRGEQRFHTGP